MKQQEIRHRIDAIDDQVCDTYRNFMLKKHKKIPYSKKEKDQASKLLQEREELNKQLQDNLLLSPWTSSYRITCYWVLEGLDTQLQDNLLLSSWETEQAVTIEILRGGTFRSYLVLEEWNIQKLFSSWNSDVVWDEYLDILDWCELWKMCDLRCETVGS